MRAAPAFASAVALTMIGSASTAPAQQDERSVFTVLFEQDNEPYRVLLQQHGVYRACYLEMLKFDQGFSVIFLTRGRNDAIIEVQINSENPPEPFRKAGSQQPFRIETSGIGQRYTLTTTNNIKTRRIAGTAKISSVARAQVPRPALSFLAAAIDSPSGMTIRVGNSRPIQFTVPAIAAYTFRECGFGS